MTGILNGTYQPMLVVLSMGVATWASFVALNVASRIWSSTGWPRIGWILAAATAMGGGIWSMHFIAMLAFSLPVPVGYSKIRKAGGPLRDYEATLCNMTHEPAVGGVVVTFHDVTERERAVSELLQAKQVSEDAPLNTILGFSEMLMNDAQGKLAEGRYRDYAKDINRSGSQLLSIINDILDFAKSDAKQLSLNESLIDAATLIEDSVRFVTPIANKKGVIITVKIAPNMPTFRGDERRLRQILLNLLSNAVKFTPAEREVRVFARVSDASGVQIEFEDTGIGIPPDQISRVMEPFYQVDGSLARTQEGTGLGLPIAKSLAELHGGTLTLESSVGYGTTARLILPPERCIRQTAAA